MSRMPPSFSGGLSCAIAALAATASTEARMPERCAFHEDLPDKRAALRCGLDFVAAIMPQAVLQRQAAARCDVCFPLSGMIREAACIAQSIRLMLHAREHR